MNNWDIKPTITVVYGADDVPFFAIQEVTKDMISESANTEHYSEDYPITVNKTDDMADDHLLSVIEALADHVGNVEVEDWLSHQNDLQVDKEEDLWVDVAYGTYYGPNCKVEVFYVTI